MATAADLSLYICFGSPIKSHIWLLRPFGSKPSIFSCQHTLIMLMFITLGVRGDLPQRPSQSLSVLVQYIQYSTVHFKTFLPEEDVVC